jgi:hypothetical protein
VEARIAAIKSASVLIEDAAVIESNRLLVEVLVAQLRVLLQAVERFEPQIAELALGDRRDPGVLLILVRAYIAIALFAEGGHQAWCEGGPAPGKELNKQ